METESVQIATVSAGMIVQHQECRLSSDGMFWKHIAAELLFQVVTGQRELGPWLGQHSPVLHPGVRLAGSFRVVLWQEAPAARALGGPDGPALAGFLLLSGVHKDVVARTEHQLVHVLGLVLEQDLQGLERRGWFRVSHKGLHWEATAIGGASRSTSCFLAPLSVLCLQDATMLCLMICIM